MFVFVQLPLLPTPQEKKKKGKLIPATLVLNTHESLLLCILNKTVHVISGQFLCQEIICHMKSTVTKFKKELAEVLKKLDIPKICESLTEISRIEAVSFIFSTQYHKIFQ